MQVVRREEGEQGLKERRERPSVRVELTTVRGHE